MRKIIAPGAAALWIMTLPSQTLAKSYTLVLTAPQRVPPDTPVTALIENPQPQDFASATLRSGAVRLPVQVRRIGHQAEVAFIAKDLKPGETRRYTLSLEGRRRNPPEPVVRMKQNGSNLDILVREKLFATYDVTTGPNKPYFYPIYAADGRRAARGYPLEKLEGETADHPHHRGLWFTHGEVNGDDYWSEGPNAGKTVHRSFEEIQSGPVYGFFRAVTDWIGKDGRKDAEDVREVRIYNVRGGRLMDFEVTVKATDGPVVFGDTKEGSFGIRVPDSMRVTAKAGHIQTSAGRRDAEAWGKRAEWVDYYGPVEGKTLGISILDHPANLRHPTYWHVRDYGLFAVNPFGIHDFVPGEKKGAGDFTIPAGGSQTFRYRVFIHDGTTDEAGIPSVWAVYAAPPKIEVIAS